MDVFVLAAGGGGGRYGGGNGASHHNVTALRNRTVLRAFVFISIFIQLITDSMAYFWMNFRLSSRQNILTKFVICSALLSALVLSVSALVFLSAMKK